MSLLARIKNRTLAVLTTRIPSVAKKFVANYQAQSTSGDIPWCQPSKPLHQARLALVTTSGIHHSEQQPFDMSDPDGDPSYREIRAQDIFTDYRITHDYYDHSDARKDPNIIFPLDRLKELEQEKVIGAVAATHYSLMGHIVKDHIPTLIEKSAREIVEKLQKDRVDLVLLTPA